MTEAPVNLPPKKVGPGTYLIQEVQSELIVEGRHLWGALDVLQIMLHSVQHDA